MEKKKSLNKWLIWLLKVGVSSIAVVYVFSKISFSEVKALYGSANWFLILLSIVLFAVSKLISAYRLQLFLRAIQVHILDLENLKLYLLGMFYNLGLPSGIGGDAYKVYLLKKAFPEVGTKSIATAALVDRFAGLSLLCVSVVVLGSFIETPLALLSYSWILIIPGGALSYLIIKKILPSFKDIAIKVNLYSLGVQLMQVLSIIVLLYAINYTMHTLDYIVLFLLSSIAGIIPITIGGLGLREAVMFEGAVWLDLNTEVAVGIGLGFYLITALVSMLGVYYALNVKAINLDSTIDTN